MELFPLFSTPIYKAQLRNDLDTVKKTVSSLDYFPYSSHNGYCSNNQNILELEVFSDLKETIVSHIQYLLFSTLNFKRFDFYFPNSWINLHKPNNFSQRHLHQNSFYSGVLYLNVPEGDSGKITFHHPNEIPTYCSSSLSPEVVEYNSFNSKEWFFSPKENTLLLFPSHLSHSVSTNNTKSDRFCLSFNIFLKGSFGEFTNQLILN